MNKKYSEEVIIIDETSKVENDTIFEDGIGLKQKSVWSSLMITVVLTLVAVLSIVQTVQTATIYNKVKSGNFGSGSSSAPASVQNLPSQVGGC